MTINTVGIIGAGQMGAGIAQVFAAFSFKVILVDNDLNALEKAHAQIEKGLHKMQLKGIITAANYIKNIELHHDIAEVKQCELIIEAIVEDIHAKKNLYRKLEDILQNPSALLCTNTSSFSIAELSDGLEHPERFCGFHFMNPAPIIPLVELIKGEKTSEKTLSTLADLCTYIKKEAVICKDSPGFIVNRILIPMVNEACLLLEEGYATAEDIDKAMKLGASFPIGPLALADLIGLDVIQAIMTTLHKSLHNRLKPANILEKYIKAGHLGKKTGRGFFKYQLVAKCSSEICP